MTAHEIHETIGATSQHGPGHPPASTRVETPVRTYVLDTSVLLADPSALVRFAEHTVIVPLVVINELEAKRHDPEIGYFARQALRHLGAPASDPSAGRDPFLGTSPANAAQA